jgi:8-oxo-dGTP pyrophosphatase MutT (NUDIX family)
MTDDKLKKAIRYAGKMFNIIVWEGRPGVEFESAVRAPGVRLLIEIEKEGKKALLMTLENRHETGGYDLRLPGGKVFDSLVEFTRFNEEKGDMSVAAELAARKEGKEEAGITGGDYSLIQISKAGASVEWDLYYFRVKNALVGEQELEESEEGNIKTVQLSAQEVFQRLAQKQVREGRTATVLWEWLNENGYVNFADI